MQRLRNGLWTPSRNVIVSMCVTISRGSLLERIVYVQYKLMQKTESGLPSTGSCSRVFYSPAYTALVICNGCPHSSSSNRVGDPTCPLISSLLQSAVLSWGAQKQLMLPATDSSASFRMRNRLAWRRSKKLTADRNGGDFGTTNKAKYKQPSREKSAVRVPLSDKVEATMGACIRTIVCQWAIGCQTDPSRWFHSLSRPVRREVISPGSNNVNTCFPPPFMCI